jgi:hypothetical protein
MMGLSFDDELDHGAHLDNIQVVVRLRPLIARELRNGSTNAWKWNETTVALKEDAQVEQSYAASQGRQTSEFNFDRVFAPASMTRELYDAALVDTVTSVMDGFHASVFCYGQTSSGKTHTVQGRDGIDRLAARGGELDSGGTGGDLAADPGLIELALRSVFGYIAEHQEREFLLRVSYLEVYNEQVNDLLVPSSTNLQLFDDTRRGCVIPGLLEEVVASRSRIVELIAAGEAHRHVGQTDFNLKSSRSHTIFRMVVESKLKSARRRTADEPRPPVRVSTLCLTDLAGSESLRGSKPLGDRAGFADLADTTYRKARQREGAFINKSLLTLSHVICMLSDLELERSRKAARRANRAGGAPPMTPVQAGHLPLRNSKLTRILSASLQGNARVAIVANCSPASGNVEETISTLKFASRAKRIKSTARVNEVLDNKALLARYKLEIRQLRSRLLRFEGGGGGAAAAPAPGRGPPGGGGASARGALIDRAQAEAEQRQLEHMIDRLNAVILNTRTAQTSSTFATSNDDGATSPSHAWDNGEFGGGMRSSSIGGGAVVSPSKAAVLRREREGAGEGGAGAGAEGEDREALALNAQRELSRIKEQLSVLLHRRREHVAAASASASSALSLGSPARSAERPSSSAVQGTILELEKRCETQRLSNTVSRADNKFLQSQLDERDRLLDTCADVIEQLMQKQGGLEEENTRLKKILVSREAEVAALKGTTLEDEEF